MNTKWIVAIIFVAAIVAALWYYQPWKKKEDVAKDSETPKDGESKSSSTTTTTTNTNTNTNTGNGQTPLKVVGAGFVLQAQKDINAAFATLRAANIPDVPTKLKEDGKFGAVTAAAIKYVYSLQQSIESRKLVKPTEIAGDMGGFSADLVRNICAVIVEPQWIAAVLSYKRTA